MTLNERGAQKIGRKATVDQAFVNGAGKVRFGDTLGLADSDSGEDFSAGVQVEIVATEGTHNLLTDEGIPAERIFKMHEGRPNIADGIKNGTIQLIINTPVGKQSQYDDSYIRKAAIKYKIPYITTLAGAFAAVKGITAYRKGDAEVRSLQSYHAAIK